MLDPGTNVSQEKNHVHFSNHMSRISDNYGSYGARNYEFGAQTTAQNYANYQTNWNSIADLGAERRLIQDDDDSGVCSPPLWRTSPPRSPQHRHNNYRSLSPTSRSQAIARGQKELMEMVSRMPEGCYELTLKDIVEQSVVDQVNNLGVKEESFSIERSSSNVISKEVMHVKEKEIKKNNEKKVKINRSGSMDNGGGFLLKMVFPVSWNSGNKNNYKKNNSSKNKIKKNDNSVMNSSGRVSPRPLLSDGSAAKGGENEWWKNRFVEKEESYESGGFSSNSGSSKSSGSGSSSSRSSSRNSSDRQVGGGCWSLIFRRRRKKAD